MLPTTKQGEMNMLGLYEGSLLIGLATGHRWGWEIGVIAGIGTFLYILAIYRKP